MPALTAELLRVLRLSEELLAELPGSDPDRETVHRLVLDLRELYAEITASAEHGERSIRSTLDTIEEAWRVLEGVRDRVKGSDVPPVLRPSQADLGSSAS